MRSRVLFTILPIAIIPILLIVGFTAFSLFDRLKNQSHQFYQTIMTQIATNIDFNYSVHATHFSDISQMNTFQNIINEPQFKTAAEERGYLDTLKETPTNPSPQSIYRLSMTKFKGAFYIVEYDKKSVFRSLDYVMHSFNYSDFYIDFTKLREEPFVQKISESAEKARTGFGKPAKGILQGYDAEKLSVFVYPYFQPGKDECSKYMVLVANGDFIPNIYRGVRSIHQGTLYALDSHDNILSYNHPSNDDYYEYDDERKTYIQNGDISYVKEEEMSIFDYKRLNTNPEILKESPVRTIIENINEELDSDTRKIHEVSYGGVKYLCIAWLAPESGIKLVYFHPMVQIYKPVFTILLGIIIISFIVCGFIIFISNYLSLRINNPIKSLSEGARGISSGNYTTHIKTDGFFGEFTDLGTSFNFMAQTINEYSENLEDLVSERTRQLNEAVKELQNAYDENKHELLIAQKIQMSLIPVVYPVNDKITFSGMYKPMDALGGDLYDVYALPDNRIGILILDVCGHGVPAALITTMAKISFYSNIQKHTNVSDILFIVNNELCNAIQGSGDYFTAFFGIIDTDTMTLQYSNAGHTDIYVLHDSKQLEVLPNNGPIVGVVKDMQFGAKTIGLKKKDRIVLYTDGIIEARNVDGKLYDTPRFIDQIKSLAGINAEKFIDQIFADITEFKGERSYADDDIAILVADLL